MGLYPVHTPLTSWRLPGLPPHLSLIFGLTASQIGSHSAVKLAALPTIVHSSMLVARDSIFWQVQHDSSKAVDQASYLPGLDSRSLSPSAIEVPASTHRRALAHTLTGTERGGGGEFACWFICVQWAWFGMVYRCVFCQM